MAADQRRNENYSVRKENQPHLAGSGRCQATDAALEAIAAADVITLGPGSLYTSLIPNLLVETSANP